MLVATKPVAGVLFSFDVAHAGPVEINVALGERHLEHEKRRVMGPITNILVIW